MRKYIYSLVAGLSLFSVSSFANQANVTINPGAFTNLLSFGPNFGSALVKQVIVTATTATNALVMLVDTPTNALTYVNPAYTNTISYATNRVVTWTNFYGGTQSYTNIVLYDITNNAVAATTNLYPIRFILGSAAGTSTPFQGVNYYFDQGVWVTNTGSGVASVTITY